MFIGEEVISCVKVSLTRTVDNPGVAKWEIIEVYESLLCL